jgi:hypothetical protein
MIKFVDLEALNLRSQSDVSPSTRIGILHLGQRVDELGPADKPGWLRIGAVIDGESNEGVVKAEIEAQPSTGFLNKQSLRNPVSDVREALVAEVIKQWLRFEKGQGLEHQDPFFKFIGEMWRAIGSDLDGKDRDTPWSAAAISFVVRNTGDTFPIYKKFKFAGAHSRYIHDSIVKRKQSDSNTPFWGFRLHEKQPQIGDIVCKSRETPRDFDDAAVSDAFKSHTDVIVSVSSDFVLAIGGNVGQSVNITRYEKTASGFIAARDGVFALMVNQG